MASEFVLPPLLDSEPRALHARPRVSSRTVARHCAPPLLEVFNIVVLERRRVPLPQPHDARPRSDFNVQWFESTYNSAPFAAAAQGAIPPDSIAALCTSERSQASSCSACSSESIVLARLEFDQCDSKAEIACRKSVV
jgi:hypothetical protein